MNHTPPKTLSVSAHNYLTTDGQSTRNCNDDEQQTTRSLLRIKSRREAELDADLSEWAAATGADRARCRRNVIAAVRMFRAADAAYHAAWMPYAARLRYDRAERDLMAHGIVAAGLRVNVVEGMM